MITTRTGFLATLALALILPAAIAIAEDAPPPGSPAATAPIDPLRLPNPPAPFGGTIALDATHSTPYWQPRTVPPEGAPNILIVLIDDEGFGAPSTFGGLIPTPELDRLASDGLRYTQFHTTSLCSPTRAALITGRNHHSAGFGVIGEATTGFPGYNSIIARDKTTIGRVLRENGYATSWFGKNHNTPAFVTSQAGPFDQWPSGMGFEYFYGFNQGETNQWQPDLYRDHTRVYPYLDDPGYNLVTDMADDAIDHIERLNALDPDKPFFVYYAPGATHAPHHPTQEWIDRFKGKFGMGWNALREQVFANQKALGVIPADAVLTDWPDDLLKRWDDLSADERKLFERQMEVYAAFLAYTDHEIGRVIQAIRDMGKYDDTMIVYISGDNGGSAEGSPDGTPNEMTFSNGVNVPVADQMRYLDAWGSDATYPHMAAGWTWAMNTPYRWTKQVSGYLGGVRNGMVITWPNRIKDAGGIRNQFHHVVDIVPTILEATGIAAPQQVDGVDQAPIEGVSLAYTFDAANAGAASTRKTQYFEMMGQRGIYHDGWMAVTVPFRTPWDGTAQPPADVVADARWELFDMTHDWTQSTNLAEQNPQKLKELQDLFWVEAAKYHVLPLDASALSRFVTPRPSIVAGRDTFTYTRPIAGIPLGTAPNVLNRSFDIAVEVEIPKGGADGMLATQGGRFAGWGFYIAEGKPVFVYNLLDLARPRIAAPDALTPGKHVVAFAFTYEGPGFGKGGTGVITIDGKEVASGQLPHTLPFALESSETFDIGSDTGTGINDADYLPPFAFRGRIDRLTLHLGGNG